MAILFKDQDLSMDEFLSQEVISVVEINKGSVVKGKVIAYQPEKSPENIILAMESKFEGNIPVKEFDNFPGIGKEVEAIVKGIDKETGLLYLSKRELELTRGMNFLKEAYEKGLYVIGEVERRVEKGYIVEVEKIKMFMPFSEVGSFLKEKQYDKRQDMVGSSFTCKILELNPKKFTGIVSKKAFQDEQNRSYWYDLIQKISVGDIIEGEVLKHSSIGAYIMTNNVVGFLHQSNIYWSKSKKRYKDKIPIGSTIKTRVLDIDEEGMKLFLGLKQTEDDPWENILNKYSMGDVVTAKVTFTAKNVAFVDITQDIEGIIYRTEMSWVQNITSTKQMLQVGDEISAKIIGINLEERKISLGLKQLQEDPWSTISDMIQVGSVKKGKIKGITNFGIFVEINDQIDGYIRKEDINWENSPVHLRSIYKEKQELEFKVIHIDSENRKIGCSLKHLLPNPYKALKEKYKNNPIVNGTIKHLSKYGLFIQIDNQFEGLLHLSEIPRGKSENIKNHFKKGDKIKVIVKKIEPDKEKIAFSLKGIEHIIEKKEISKYISKDVQQTMDNPFKGLKNMLQSKEVKSTSKKTPSSSKE